MPEYILTTPDRRQRLCTGGQLGISAPPLIFYSEAVARAIATNQPDLHPLNLIPVRYTMPDTLPKTAVSAAEAIAVIAAKMTTPTVHREYLGATYLTMAMAVHDAAQSLAERIGTAAL